MRENVYFLVYYDCESNLDSDDNPFLEFLEKEEFSCDAGFWGCPWYFVDIEEKTYKPGRPGVSYGIEIGGHAITFEEFKTIYEIYKKYDGLGLFEMKPDRSRPKTIKGKINKVSRLIGNGHFSSATKYAAEILNYLKDIDNQKSIDDDTKDDLVYIFSDLVNEGEYSLWELKDACFPQKLLELVKERRIDYLASGHDLVFEDEIWKMKDYLFYSTASDYYFNKYYNFLMDRKKDIARKYVEGINFLDIIEWIQKEVSKQIQKDE